MLAQQPEAIYKTTHAGIREFVPPGSPLFTYLIAACRAVDRDIECAGAVSAKTVDLVRDALARADAA